MTPRADPREVLAGRQILVVARWYPAFDDRASGIFVADHAWLLAAHGADVVVASWDPTPLLAGADVEADRLSASWAAAVAASPPLASPRSWGPGLPVVRLPAVTRPRVAGRVDELGRARAQAASLRAFGRRLHEAWPIDLIHAHTGLPDGAAAADLADALGVPLVTSEHDSTLLRRLADTDARDLYRRLFGPRRAVVAPSAFLAERLGAVLGESVGVLPNAVDVDAFAPSSATERDPELLLWVGRRRASKGMPALLEAVAVARAARPGVRLLALGSASDEEDAAWRGRAAELGITEAVRFEPAADRAAIAAAMQSAGAFVHPSPFETFGLVAAEALAAGLPVVCTPSGGVDEIVGPDGVAGEVARGIDGKSLGEAILRLLGREGTADAAKMRRRVADRFGADVVAEATANLYAPLLHPRTASTASLPARTPRPSAPVVVAFRRTALIPRVDGLAPNLRAALTVLTAGTSGMAQPDGVAEWIEVDDDSDARRRLASLDAPTSKAVATRVAWLVRHPLAAVRRRLIARSRPRARLDARRAAVANFLEGRRASHRGQPIEMIVVDSDDRLAVEPFVTTDVRITPGGLRWLADAWDEAQGPGGEP